MTKNRKLKIQIRVFCLFAVKSGKNQTAKTGNCSGSRLRNGKGLKTPFESFSFKKESKKLFTEL